MAGPWWPGGRVKCHVETFMILRIRGCFTEWIWLLVYLLPLVEDMLLARNCRNGKKADNFKMSNTNKYWNEKHGSYLCSLKLHVTGLWGVLHYQAGLGLGNLHSVLHLASGLALSSTFSLFHTNYFTPLGETVKISIFFILQSHFLIVYAFAICDL